MKHIFLSLLALAPALAFAQTGTVKDSVRVLTTAEIAQGNSKDSAHLYFIDTTWKKIRMDSLARFARVKLIGDRGDITVSGEGLTWSVDNGAITGAKLATGAVDLTATTVTGTLPVNKGGTNTSTAFTTGSVVFAGSGGTYTQDNSNFFWDDANDRLRIAGSSTLNSTLSVNGASESKGAVTSVESANGYSQFVHANNKSGGTDLPNFPRVYYRIFGSSSPNNAGFVIASGNATGSTQIPVFMALSSNSDILQANSKQINHYLEGTTAYHIITANAGGNGTKIPYYIGGINVNNSPTLTLDANSRVGIDMTAPAARLHLPAGALAAESAPLKFTSGTNMSNSEAGAMEYNNEGANIGRLYFTPDGGGANTRYTINMGLTATASLTFAATNGGAHDDKTITVSGATAGDVVSLGVPNGAVFDATCYTAWVSANDTVTVRFNNYSGTQRTPTGSFKVLVTKF